MERTEEVMQLNSQPSTDVVKRRLKEMVEIQEVKLVERPGRKGFLYFKTRKAKISP